MTRAALLAEILRLPPRDRMKLMARVLDETVLLDAEPIPEWHKEELDRRLAEPPGRLYSWEEALRELRVRTR